MFDEIYSTIFTDWQNFKLPKVLPRDIRIDVAPVKHIRKATVITGFRRTGKTYILYSLISKLLHDLSKSDLLYVNFEDE
ncbi:AAA family ATPase, partial [Candidatus Microgenomates bacterium]|nr:AAA family ATPase [Candidatus Microgenomates bacterium]